MKNKVLKIKQYVTVYDYKNNLSDSRKITKIDFHTHLLIKNDLNLCIDRNENDY
jgi:hypothetical protein